MSAGAILDRRIFLSNGRTIAAVVLAWSIVAVIATTTAFIAIRGDSVVAWLSIFGPMMLYYSVWVGVSLLIYRIVETLNGTPARRMLAAAAHVLLFLAVAISLPFIVHYNDWQTWLYGARAPGYHTLAAVIYLLNLLGSLLIRFYRLSVAREREAREARLRSSLLQNQLNLARMDALKMQINPHFLFNALNSIAALIETDRNVEAYHATELLGELLRSTLDKSGDRFLTLQQELEFIRRYIDIEKVRFGNRFEYVEDVDENCLDHPVPTLILQPLVENSIKHAVNESTAPVSLVLAARQETGGLAIEVSDNGPGFSATSGNGVGLDNVRRRLDLLYAGNARFEVTSAQGRGVTTTLLVPQNAADSVSHAH